MAATRVRPRKTVEDYMRLPDDVRAELIDGEILMSPSPLDRHQRIVFRLARKLADFVEAGTLGEVFIAPFDVHLPTGDVVEPDIFFVSVSRLDIVKGWVRGVPDLIIEILSPTGLERDRFIKRDLYARNGVLEYWLVDTEAESIEVLSLHAECYEPAGYFTGSETIISAIIPGLPLRARDVFP